jgi:hypothetical protein
MTLWMMWAVLATLLLAMAGLSVEGILRSRARQSRFVWIAVLGASAGLQFWSWLRPRGGSTQVPSSEPAGSGFGLQALLADATPAVSPEWMSWLSQWDGPVVVGWVVASVLATSMIAFGLVRLMRHTRQWVPASVDGEDVLLSDSFGPALVGFFSPRIVMPRWTLGLDREQRRLALLHESEHRAAHDTLLLLAGAAAVALTPWNPALWWAVSRLRQAVELDCDLRVLDAGTSRSSYGELLIDLSARTGAAPFPAAALARPVSLLERRLTMMTNDGRRLGPIRTTALGAGAVLLAIAACEAPAPSAISNVDAEAETVTAAPVVVEVGGVPVGSGEGEPLVYVDGVRLAGAGRAALDDLNPDLIERIEVLKGEAAQRLFGDEAANGVIQIFTRDAPSEAAGILQRRDEHEQQALRLIDEAEERLEAPVRNPDGEFTVQLGSEASPLGCRASEWSPDCPPMYVDGELYEGAVADLNLDPDLIDRIEVRKTEDERAIWIYLKNN